MDILTDEPDRFGWLEEILLSRRETDPPQPYPIEGIRFHQQYVLLKLGGVEDRQSAETLRNYLVRVPRSEAIPLGEGEFFLFQLLGMDVISDDETWLGTVRDIIQTGANDVFVVDGGPHGEILLPDTEEVVLRIDADARHIIVHLLDGLLAGS